MSTKNQRSKRSKKTSENSAIAKNINNTKTIITKTKKDETRTGKIERERVFYQRSIIDQHFKNLTEEAWTDELVKVSTNPNKLVFVKDKEPLTNFATTISEGQEKLTMKNTGELIKASSYNGHVSKKIKVDKTISLEEISDRSLELADCDAIAKYARVNKISDSEFKLISTRIARLFEQNTLDWIKNKIFDFTYNTNMVKIYHEVYKKIKWLSEENMLEIQQIFIKFINEDYNEVKLSYTRVLIAELAKDNLPVNYCLSNLMLVCDNDQSLKLLKEGLYSLLKKGKKTEVILKALKKNFDFDSEINEPQNLKVLLGTKFKVALMKTKAA